MAQRGSAAEKPRRGTDRPAALAQRLPREPNADTGDCELLALTLATHRQGDIE
jgi:hypothetical protein